MSTAESAQFVCEGCGKTYKWKPELAGKRAKCSCGRVIEVPKNVPAPEPSPEPSFDDLYALAESANSQPAAQADFQSCPSCNGPLPAGAVICVHCGYNFRTGARMQPGGAATAVAPAPAPARPVAGGYLGTGRKRDAGEASSMSPLVMDLYVPAGLLVVGAALGIWRIMASGDMSFIAAIAFFFVWILFECVMVFLGCLVGIKWLGISLGEPLKAFVKIGAVVVGPFGLALVVAAFTHWMVGFLVAPLLYYILLTQFFDMDLGEVLLLSGVIYAIQYLSRVTLLLMVLNALFGSVPTPVAGIAGMALMGSFSGPSLFEDEKPDPTIVQKNAEEDDKLTLKIKGTLIDAKDFLTNESNHYFGLKREEATALIDDLLAKGAKQVGAADCHGGAIGKTAAWSSDMLLVELPTDKAARTALFDKYNTFQTPRGYKPIKDVGQKYIRFWTDSKIQKKPAANGKDEDEAEADDDQ